MTSRAFFTGLLRRGKQVLQNVVKSKTQNSAPRVEVKVGTANSQVVQFRPQVNERFQSLWNKIIPKVYFNSQASRLGGQAAWRSGRCVPLMSFVGLVVAQNMQKEKDEVVNGINEFVKTVRTTESPLLQQIQQLSLDNFDFGKQIGQGCNAAVYEAKLKETETVDNLNDSLEPVTPLPIVKEEFVAEAADHSDSESDITILSSDDDDYQNQCEEQVPTDFYPEDSVIKDNISQTGSDIAILNISDDNITDSQMAPLEFQLNDETILDSVSEAGSDFSILTFDDEDFILERQQEGPVEFFPFENRSILSNIVEEADDDIIVLNTKDEVDDKVAQDSPRNITYSQILSDIGEQIESLKNSDAIDTVYESVTEYDSMNSTLQDDDTSGMSKFDLAVKMMFNYGIESNANTILREMEKEAVPARLAQSHEQMETWQNGNKVRKKRLPPHPNIVEMWGVFVDPVPNLPECLVNFPAALPARINPKGVGRNMTMFLVMKKYSTTLRDYLSVVSLSFRERLMLLTQLLEAVDHMGKHGIAHRDMKSDNILLDTSVAGVPQLVVSDFGCCLADVDHGLKLPYPTNEMPKGGNAALMAPEIACAKPGRYSTLDYSKADLWSVGTLAYEILGADNPFYNHSQGGNLCSATYREAELPPLPESTPNSLQKLVTGMLSRDPKMRPTARTAADLLHLLLWAPSDWLLPGNTDNIRDTPCDLFLTTTVEMLKVKWWLVTMAAETVLERKGANKLPVETMMKTLFLETMNMNRLKHAFGYLGMTVA